MLCCCQVYDVRTYRQYVITQYFSWLQAGDLTQRKGPPKRAFFHNHRESRSRPRAAPTASAAPTRDPSSSRRCWGARRRQAAYILARSSVLPQDGTMWRKRSPLARVGPPVPRTSRRRRRPASGSAQIRVVAAEWPLPSRAGVRRHLRPAVAEFPDRADCAPLQRHLKMLESPASRPNILRCSIWTIASSKG